MANDKIKHISKADFATVTKGSKVLIDFWATWCGPCRQQLAILDELVASEDFPADAVIGKVDVDQEPELAREFSVEVVPTLVIYKNGKIAQRFTGVQDVNTLLLALE